MPRFSLGSLRSRAITLVLLAILPLLALTLYSYFNQRARAIREVQRDELVAARNLASIQETLIRNTRNLLQTLAQMPVLKRLDPERCNAFFKELLKDNPAYAVIVAVDLEGRVFASFPAAPGPVNVADRLWFQKVIQTRDFFVGEPVRGRISGKYNLNMSYPILDDAGNLRGAIVAGVDLDWLGSLIAKSDMPPSTAMVLTDATYKVLFRYPEPLKYIGKLLPEVLIKAMAESDEGVAEGIGLPGDERLFAFARLAPPWQDFRVAIGLARHPALARVNEDLRRNLFWLGLVALVCLTAAWYGGDMFIVRPIRKLRGVTGRLAAGDLTGRAGPNYAVGELGLLARSFDQMADAIQERDARLKLAAGELAERVAQLDERTAQLEEVNQELEAFSYSVSHDLRAPLRGIDGFARALLEDYAASLDKEAQRYLTIIRTETQKMGQLIDDLLTLSRLGRKDMKLASLDLEELARTVVKEITALYPDRKLNIEIQPLPRARADHTMLRQVLMNLLQNAVKFTRTRQAALIEVSGWEEQDRHVYRIKDNGVGFDMAYADKLFGVFQRLHREKEFEGTGVGLAIVQRLIHRHGGQVWAEGKPGEGASFYFSLPK